MGCAAVWQAQLDLSDYRPRLSAVNPGTDATPLKPPPTLTAASSVRLWLRVGQLGTVLFDSPSAHRGDAVGDVLHHADVVGDERVAHAQFARQVFEQGKPRRANGSVDPCGLPIPV